MTQTKSSNNHRGLIQLKGEDSAKFLQGQVTCDIDSLTGDREVFGAHCTPSGRVVFVFSAHRVDAQCIILETHPSVVELAVASLSKYAVFFKTQITAVGDGEIPIQPPISSLERLRRGRPDITTETTEQFIPQMLNLDLMDYISFKKGCYTGQEVVARAHYRGEVKRRMHHLSLSSSSPVSCFAPGTAILDSQGKALGNLVNCELIEDNRIEALAVLANRALELESLTVEGEKVDVTYLPLPYQLT